MAVNYQSVLDEARGRQTCELATRKLYLSYPTAVFKDLEDVEFAICEEIRLFLGVPYSSIKIVGSAKTGFSIVHKKQFDPSGSDIDVAVIDTALFVKYLELGLALTDGSYDPVHFSRDRKSGGSNRDFYVKCLSKGVFRPDLMPIGPGRQEWRTFFNALSQKFRQYAKSISVGVYVSECAFIQKQKNSIQNIDSGVGFPK